MTGESSESIVQIKHLKAHPMKGLSLPSQEPGIDKFFKQQKEKNRKKANSLKKFKLVILDPKKVTLEEIAHPEKLIVKRGTGEYATYIPPDGLTLFTKVSDDENQNPTQPSTKLPEAFIPVYYRDTSKHEVPSQNENPPALYAIQDEYKKLIAEQRNKKKSGVKKLTKTLAKILVMKSLEPAQEGPDSGYLMVKARKLSNQNRDEEAMALYNQIVKKSPNAVFGYTGMAEIYKKRGQIKKHDKMLEKARKVADKRPAA